MEKKILLVEDDLEIRGIFADWLEVNGVHELQLALDAEEALVCIRTAPYPDLIITDLGLRGEISGWDFLIRLKNSAGETAKIPVIVLSGTADQTARARAAELGAAAFFQKPPDFDKFNAEIRACLQAV